MTLSFRDFILFDENNYADKKTYTSYKAAEKYLANVFGLNAVPPNKVSFKN